MSLSIPNRVVVFDYGEVISRSPNEADRAVLLDIADVDGDAFWASYWEHRDDLDQGRVDVPGYWARIAADTGAEWKPSTVYALWVADFRSWISVEPGTIDHKLYVRGVGTVLEQTVKGGSERAALVSVTRS